MQTLQHVDIINKEDENIFNDLDELFWIKPIEGELVYTFNVFNEGLDTEDKIKNI